MKHTISSTVGVHADDFFALSRSHFRAIVMKLHDAGIAVSPHLQLQWGEGLLCHYDHSSLTIHIASPEGETPYGRLQSVLLHHLFNYDSDEDLADFLHIMMGWLIAHAIAQHCRHHLGLLTKNIWQEAQIANYLAIALCKPQFSSEARVWCDAFLQRAIHNMSANQRVGSSPIDSYHSLPHSLFVAGLIDARTFEHITRIRHQTGYLSEVILKNRLVDNLPQDIEQRVHNRHKIIKHINAGSERYVLQHLYYQLGWMHIGMISTEQYSVQAFKQHFLIGSDRFALTGK